MKLIADENVTSITIARLRQDGHDVQSIRETFSGAADETVLAAAKSENRLIVTEDRDFGELSIKHERAAAGIVLLELHRLSLEAGAERVSEVLAELGGAAEGALTVIEPSRVRIRRFTASS